MFTIKREGVSFTVSLVENRRTGGNQPKQCEQWLTKAYIYTNESCCMSEQ